MCTRVGSAASAPGPPQAAWAQCEGTQAPLPSPGPAVGSAVSRGRPRPTSGSRRGGRKGLGAGGARRPGKKRSEGPFRALRPQCHHRRLTFVRTGSRANRPLSDFSALPSSPFAFIAVRDVFSGPRGEKCGRPRTGDVLRCRVRVFRSPASHPIPPPPSADERI